MNMKAFALTLALLGVGAAVSDIAFDIRPRLLYNPSPSAPVGWYSVEAASSYSHGDRVAAFAPEDARALADARGYLPFEYPLIKSVWAGPGETVCRSGERVSAPGRSDITGLLQDGTGRVMPVWSGCAVLGPSQYFLTSPDYENSWDSRYFGAVSGGDIMGRVHYLGESLFSGEPEE